MKSINYLLGFLLIGMCFSTKAQHNDPAFLQVVSAENEITIDGVLDETDWARRFDYLVFGANAKPGDVSYTVTGGIEVKGPYTDTTTTSVYVMHKGLDLYIALRSNDQSVGKFGTSWEGDGIFMKIKDANGTANEYKLYFNLGGENPEINFEQPGLYPNSGTAAAQKLGSTIVNDTTAADSGYTAELLIDLEKLGYTDPNAEVEVMMNIFDPDGYKDDTDPWGTVGAYHKMWWGSEWGDQFRKLRLADPENRKAFKTNADLTVDGQLTEDFWASADSVVVGKGSALSTGGFYMQYNDTNNVYSDQSMATIKFVHKGTDLYIGVESDDASVCKWSPGWEADGLFLWMTNKGETSPTQRIEIKNMYFSGNEGDGTELQLSGTVPTGSVEGASFEPTGTTTHTESNGADKGYSLELLVRTDYFGYQVGDTVMLSACVWDLDYASTDAFSPDSSDYAPNWWGTQWADPNFEKYFMYRGVILSDEEPTSIEDITTSLPTQFSLKQNYPNPFNPTTNIKYSITRSSKVTLKVFDILGAEVATLVNSVQKAGTYKFNWNAANLSSGIYFYKLQADDFVETKRMLLLK